MIDHISLRVASYETSKQFYQRALAPLGYAVILEFPGAAGFGAGRPDFWIGQGEPRAAVHVAFRGSARAVVDAFYTAALAAGGRDNGAPGVRPHYHPHYYGAFVLDPDGNNVEVVCHEPE
jgi:catechol 2,3-dioxygenase-like lactoylglutathione lyase family enzyme